MPTQSWGWQELVSEGHEIWGMDGMGWILLTYRSRSSSSQAVELSEGRIDEQSVVEESDMLLRSATGGLEG